jgi:hypothetical protein
VNPPVVVWDAAAGQLFLVVEVRRQDYCLGLRLWFAASHAASVAGVSSVTPGVSDRTSHEQPPGKIKKRQATCLRFCSHDGNHLGDTLGLLALVWPPCVHLCGLGAAGAGWRWLNAETLQ